VANALHSAGYQVTVLDGRDSVSTLLNMLGDNRESFDVIFPVLHGAEGESGVLQAELEPYGVPCVGSDEAASQQCFYKDQYRQILQENLLPIAPGEMVSAGEDSTSMPFAKSEFIEKPFVLKPYDSGSSIDTFIVRDPSQAPLTEIEAVLKRRQVMLIEELIEGTEITLSILEDKPLTPIEIIPPAGQEFDYENKYNGKTQELCPPVHVAAPVLTEAQSLARQIHTLLGCKDYSRTDMIARPDGKLVILETNTLPGMTDQSLFPKAAAASGIDMPTLVRKMVKANFIS
jgi:D-alanine-D-alanine ligase